MTRPSFLDRKNSDRLKQLVSEFARLEGRQPRVMLSSVLPLDEEEEISDFAVSLSGLGFDVDIGPVARSFEQLGLNALESDVDVLILFRLDHGDEGNFQMRLKEFVKQKGCDDLLILYDPSGLSSSHVLKMLEKWLAGILE